jgi:hypothetical protein
MPLKCYIKPNRTRKRVFTAKDCGRIVCYAIDDGAIKEEVFKEVSRCLGDPCQYDRIEQIVKWLLEALAAILLSIKIAKTVIVAVRVLVVLVKRIPLANRLLKKTDKSILAIEDAMSKAQDITAKVEELERIINLRKE